MKFDTRLLHGIFPPVYQASAFAQESGVYEDLIRDRVGLEDIEKLKEDFAQAISKIYESGDNYGG